MSRKPLPGCTHWGHGRTLDKLLMPPRSQTPLHTAVTAGCTVLDGTRKCDCCSRNNLLSSPKHLKRSLTLHVAEFQLTASRSNLTDVLLLEWCGISIPAAAWLGTCALYSPPHTMLEALEAQAAANRTPAAQQVPDVSQAEFCSCTCSWLQLLSSHKPYASLCAWLDFSCDSLQTEPH